MENLDYGIVGNCQSAALISKNASIDWCCLPAFDSPSIFAKLLDQKKGGSFEILVGDDYTCKQKYIYRTNILMTTFSNGSDEFIVVDFMPRYKLDGEHSNSPEIIRYLKIRKGQPKFRVKYDPRLEYAKPSTKTEIHRKFIKSYTKSGSYDSLYLYTDLNKQDVVEGNEITLTENSFFVITYNQKVLNQTAQRCYLKLQRTKVYWLDWVENIKSFTKYNDEIVRSTLTLKLLSFDKTGAVLAAATTSLPETIGEVRNWDYRFCWIRDASMVIRVMTQLGQLSIAKRYLKFILDIIPDKGEKIQIMYGIHREKTLTEKTLDHLSGYENSSPVRIGNAAYKQKQNDIYGVLMDVLYQQFNLFDTSLQNSEDLWTITRSVVRTVEQNWEKPDKGIWEIRHEDKHFTFSKVLCWVAVDRGVKIARLIGMNDYVQMWSPLRDEIKDDILKNGWNTKMKSFTQFYGSDDMDASNLLMESYGFIDAEDPKFKSTVKQTKKQLLKGGLMYRYVNKDDFGTPSSSFTICTFWLINSLFKIGEKKQAVELFEQLNSYSNHLGLYSEDIDFKSKRLLGNFPQAYSHLAYIETAILISGHLSKDDKILEAIHH